MQSSYLIQLYGKNIFIKLLGLPMMIFYIKVHNLESNTYVWFSRCVKTFLSVSFLDRIPEPGRMAGTSIEEPLVLQSINRWYLSYINLSCKALWELKKFFFKFLHYFQWDHFILVEVPIRHKDGVLLAANEKILTKAFFLQC